MTTATRPTKRKIKGVHIDALNRTIKDIEFEPSLDEMYRLVNCGIVQFVRLYGTSDCVIVDDEGLLNDPQHFFAINGRWGGPLAGNGLIVGGPDEDGNETDSILKTADIEISFFSMSDVRENAEEGHQAVCSSIEDICIAKGLNMRIECEKRMQCGLWELTTGEARELLRQLQEATK